MENLLLKEFSKKYLIFLDFRAIVAHGSILVEQRVDESPLFLVGFQQERVSFRMDAHSRETKRRFYGKERRLRAEDRGSAPADYGADRLRVGGCGVCEGRQ